MPAFMICNYFTLRARHHHRAPLRAHHDFVLGQLKVRHLDLVLVATRRQQCGLVDKVLEVSAREARGRAREFATVDVVGQRHLARMHLQDALAPLHVG